MKLDSQHKVPCLVNFRPPSQTRPRQDTGCRSQWTSPWFVHVSVKKRPHILGETASRPSVPLTPISHITQPDHLSTSPFQDWSYFSRSGLFSRSACTATFVRRQTRGRAHYPFSLTEWCDADLGVFSGDPKTWHWPGGEDNKGLPWMSSVFHVDLCWVPKDCAHRRPVGSQGPASEWWHGSGICAAHGRYPPRQLLVYLPSKQALAETVSGGCAYEERQVLKWNFSFDKLPFS